MIHKMHFDAPEKSLDLSFVEDSPDLRLLPQNIWTDFLRLARVNILSHIQGKSCTAFLLSESSLLVFKNRLLLITCGGGDLETTERELHHIPRLRDWHTLISDQVRISAEDCQIITHKYDCRSSRALKLSRRHRFIMQGLDTGAVTRLEKCYWFLPCFALTTSIFTKLDSHIFTDPPGYSLNALTNSAYATLHVSPLGQNSYASFETDLPEEQAIKIMAELKEIFRPRLYSSQPTVLECHTP